MKHTIHRGADEVGGNCVEVTHGTTRLVLDRRLEVVHSSGHLLEEDIRRFVRTVNPKRIVPIHTFEPQRVAALAKGAAIRETAAENVV